MKKTKNIKKRRKILNIFSSIIFGITFITTSIALFFIYRLNILPSRYMIIALVSFIVLMALLGILAVIPKIKKGIKIFSMVILILIQIALVLGILYLNKTNNFLKKIETVGYQTEDYYVLVLKDSEYKDIEDLEGNTLAIYEDSEYYVSALREVKREVSPETVIYDNNLLACNKLISGEVEAVLVSASYKSMLEELMTDFNELTKVLHIETVKIESEIEVKDADVTEEPFNIYISGIDLYGNINQVSRSDVNMIVTVNPKTNKILLTSIPRDYYVQLDGTRGYKDKLTHAGIYGVDKSIGTIENLLDIDLNYYVRVNFSTVVALIDAIGGITVYSDQELTPYLDKECHYIEGYNELDGVCALAFARERHAYVDGDRHRIENQQAVFQAMFDKITNSTTIITKYATILDSLVTSIETSMPSDKIYDLVNLQLNTMPSWDITTYSLDGSNSKEYTYSMGSTNKLYVMIPDEDTVTEANRLINNVINGVEEVIEENEETEKNE